MTQNMIDGALFVARAHRAGGWYRAGDSCHGVAGRETCQIPRCGSGERVTLAALHRRGWLVRRAWRGQEGSSDAAHEYRLSDVALAAIAIG